MAASIYPPYPPALNQEQLAHLLHELQDWSVSHGLAVRPSSGFVSKELDPQGVLAVTAPVTLFPSLFPRACFEEALSIQTAYNQLYAAIARDEDWLGEVMKELIGVDDFIARLWEIHLKVKDEGYVQDLSLGLFRSDYMVHADPSGPSPRPQIRQVEFNTIASSFGGLSSLVSLLHKHLLASTSYPVNPTLVASNLPDNQSTKALAEGLAAAHAAYGSSKSTPTLPLCILFIVQDPERNIFDQRHLEYALGTASVAVFRLPFSQTLARTSVSNQGSRPLIYMPPHLSNIHYEVTTVYFRSTYSPSDYPEAGHWESRYQLERSAAIKCPSVLLHLAGSKKIQQILATPSSPHLSRFLPDETIAERVRKTFADIYPLDGSEAGRHAKLLATNPERAHGFVLKPQREGGGNNIYRDAIPSFLEALGPEDKWRSHILMEIIEPPVQLNAIVREGLLKQGEVIAELGVYGTCLWRSNGQVLRNEPAGYLLRTKARESEEGGVAAGFGAVDSVVLVDL